MKLMDYKCNGVGYKSKYFNQITADKIGIITGSRRTGVVMTEFGVRIKYYNSSYQFSFDKESEIVYPVESHDEYHDTEVGRYFTWEMMDDAFESFLKRRKSDSESFWAYFLNEFSHQGNAIIRFDVYAQIILSNSEINNYTRLYKSEVFICYYLDKAHIFKNNDELAFFLDNELTIDLSYVRFDKEYVRSDYEKKSPSFDVFDKENIAEMIRAYGRHTPEGIIITGSKGTLIIVQCNGVYIESVINKYKVFHNSDTNKLDTELIKSEAKLNMLRFNSFLDILYIVYKELRDESLTWYHSFWIYLIYKYGLEVELEVDDNVTISGVSKESVLDDDFLKASLLCEEYTVNLPNDEVLKFETLTQLSDWMTDMFIIK